ncbi:ABC transporter ATP-binding protein [Gracilibacillus alcaliphilus]|uniref:ABC transporter ATP-binding protein n=1 Tax=Gracilibacillus alcaliphilus TaxID=1401441 RepID=UPI00195DFC21|nr:ABC transporter ATP-binding protein [Gracilibacillus alcaliphilus]MBM7677054.1 ABC-2 type transport system ATP-binding protein [Gracilibacillus alcaliphilus]
MLETTSLRKVYKKTTAVDDVNFYLKQGESVGLLGPNGAGKSTLISMISTLLKPTSGTVMWNGEDILKSPNNIRPILGVVPQEIALYKELSAYENVKFFGKIYGIRGKKLEARAQEVLELVGLANRQKEQVQKYSGGMQRRINIAVALLHEPEIIIMDEPTVGIDPQSRSYILDMVKQLKEEKGMTVLYTSHYMEEVERLCDRIYIMDHGKVIATGSKAELISILSSEETIQLGLDKPSKAFQEALTEHNDILKVTTNEKGLTLIISKDSRPLTAIFRMAEEHDVMVNGINITIPSLEDVFLHLTGRKLRD